MWPTSAQFLPALGAPHRIAARADVFDGAGNLLAGDLPFDPDSSSIQVDGTAAVRRTLTLSVPDVRSWMPYLPADPLAPYGQQVQVYRGIVLGETPELIPVGRFRIDDPGGDLDMGPVSLTGKSLEAVVSDDVFDQPWTTAGYSTCVAGITGAIRRTIPGAVVTNLGTDQPLGNQTFDTGGDPMGAVQAMAAVMGATVYCDPQGSFVIAPVPDISTAAPVWSVTDGAGGTLVAQTRVLSRPTANRWIVSAETSDATTAPVTGTAADIDPTSPTRYGGPMGRITRTATTSLATTSTGCLGIAQANLRTSLVGSVQTTISVVPNPALEAWDCIRVAATGRDPQLYLVQSFPLPLGVSGDCTLTCGTPTTGSGP